jgi:hypothetical protein
MHAAALDTRFTHVELKDPTITSWVRDVVAKPLRSNLLGHVVPGALQKYDLPDLQKLMPNSVIPDPPAREHRVLHWRFDGNLNSEDGRHNGIALGNAVAGGADGAFTGSGAVYFDGANDAVSINKTVLGSGPFTITFWSKTHSGDTAGYLLSDSTKPENLFLRRYDADGNSVFNGWISEIQFGRLGPDGTDDSSWPDNVWHHHVITVDDYGRQSWYVNGNLIQTLFGEDFDGLSSSLFLGNRADMSRDFKGWIDDLQIYNWGLSAEEAFYLFQHPGDTILDRIPGDADGNGAVNAQDAAAVADHWGQSGNWSDGDFNGDGTVDILDASILAANWTGSGESHDAPEPNALALLTGLGAVFLLQRT